MQGKAAVGFALAALAALLPPASPAAEAPSFSESEIRAILAHGPWPAPATRDPSNRVSGKREAIELGERLFFVSSSPAATGGPSAPRPRPTATRPCSST